MSNWGFGFQTACAACAYTSLGKLPFEVIAAEFADVAAALQSAQLCAFAAASLVETPKAAIGMCQRQTLPEDTSVSRIKPSPALHCYGSGK